jgi:hypothetical protein
MRHSRRVQQHESGLSSHAAWRHRAALPPACVAAKLRRSKRGALEAARAHLARSLHRPAHPCRTSQPYRSQVQLGTPGAVHGIAQPLVQLTGLQCLDLNGEAAGGGWHSALRHHRMALAEQLAIAVGSLRLQHLGCALCGRCPPQPLLRAPLLTSPTCHLNSRTWPCTQTRLRLEPIPSLATICDGLAACWSACPAVRSCPHVQLARFSMSSTRPAATQGLLT